MRAIGREVRETVPDQVPLPRDLPRAPHARHSGPMSSTRSTSRPTSSARDARPASTRRLVREQRLAQDASVFVFPVVGGASMFALWVTARPGVEPETLEAATLAEIDRLAADGPTEADLERVRNLHAAHAAGALERISERADRLSMYTCLFDEPERINTESSRWRRGRRGARLARRCAHRCVPTTG